MKIKTKMEDGRWKIAKTLALAAILYPLSSILAPAQLTVSVTPGYRLNSSERITIEKLNLLGAPTVSVAGTLTGSSLAAGGVEAVHLNTNAADQLTVLGGYDGASTTLLRVNYDTNSLALNAGVLGVKSNSIGTAELETNMLTLPHLVANWLDAAGVTNTLPVNVSTNNPGTNTFLLIGTSSNVGTNGSPTNTTFSLATLATVQAAMATSTNNTNVINALISAAASTNSYTGTNASTLAVGTHTFAHGLAATPAQVRAVLLCVTTASPWFAGDELDTAQVFNSSGSATRFGVWANATNVTVGVHTADFSAVTASGTRDALTPSRWKIKVYARP